MLVWKISRFLSYSTAWKVVLEGIKPQDIWDRLSELEKIEFDLKKKKNPINLSYIFLNAKLLIWDET